MFMYHDNNTDIYSNAILQAECIISSDNSVVQSNISFQLYCNFWFMILSPDELNQIRELQKVVHTFVKQSIAQAVSENSSVIFGLEFRTTEKLHNLFFFFCMRSSVFPLILCVFAFTHKENQLHIFLSCFGVFFPKILIPLSPLPQFLSSSHYLFLVLFFRPG